MNGLKQISGLSCQQICAIFDEKGIDYIKTNRQSDYFQESVLEVSVTLSDVDAAIENRPKKIIGRTSCLDYFASYEVTDFDSLNLDGTIIFENNRLKERTRIRTAW